jgi:hypothetical protein
MISCNQLKLFDDELYEISYWAYPFDKKGNYIFTRMEKYIDIKKEHELKDFIKDLELLNYMNINFRCLVRQ